MIRNNIGKYLINEKLHDGESVLIFRGRDDTLGRDVILAIAKEKINSQADSSLMVSDASTIEREPLEHKNLLEAMASGYEDGHFYQVFEFHDGTVLSDRLGEKAVPENAAQILLTLARTLAYMHEQGVVHGKVAPSNILVLPDNSSKLMRIEIQEQYQDWVAEEESIPYQAPEMLRGDTADIQTDIYSVGAIFYHLVTGQVPYPADTKEKVLEQILSGSLIRPTKLVKGLRFIYELVILKALVVDPSKRFPDMATFAVALQDLSTGKKSMQITRKKLSKLWIGVIAVTVFFVWFILQGSG
jgi:eukaryotic-like serine/threonine-protein kinase